MAAAAGVAVRIVDVRLYGTAVARLDGTGPLTHGQHFHAQFVAGDARIAVERHLALVARVIGAADADPMDPHQRLPWTRALGLGDVDLLEMEWLFQEDGFHQD